LRKSGFERGKTPVEKTCNCCSKKFLTKNRASKCSTCRKSIKCSMNRDVATSIFSGKCQICGYDRTIKALCFHHVYPQDKEFMISQCWHYSWKRLIKELEKCVMICSNCHDEIHDNLIPIEKIESIHKLNKDKLVNLTSDKYELYVKLKKENYIKSKEKFCFICKKKFVGSKNRKYCSYECLHFSQRRVVRPSMETLKNEIDEGIPWSRLGEKYKVSDNAIRKWAMVYGLIKTLDFPKHLDKKKLSECR